MNTYYARHSMDIDANTLNAIWSDDRIGIHYPQLPDGSLGSSDSTSIDPKDYKGPAKGAVAALQRLARYGGFVCAEYLGKTDCILGFVEPASTIQLWEGRWRTKERQAILKTLKLSRTRRVAPSEWAVILVGRPRQGTLCRWPNAGRLIEYLVEGIAIKESVESLSPTQQEVLCSELLRSPLAHSVGLPYIRSLLLPVGRTLKDIDILGISDTGRRVFVQVTYRSLTDASTKLAHLKRYASRDAELLLFCAVPTRQIVDGVTVFPLEQAFSTFVGTDAGRAWLDATLPQLPRSAAQYH